MDYSHYTVLLLFVGLALLILEILLPSGGFLGVLMLASIVGSVVCAYYAWWDSSRNLWWAYVCGVVVLLPAVLIASFTLLPRTRYGQHILLDAPKSEDVTPNNSHYNDLLALVGSSAIAETPHRPSGIVSIDGQRFHSETRGAMLEAGDLVTVVEVRGNRLVVRHAERVKEEGMREEPKLVDEESSEREEKRLSDSIDPFLGDAENT